MLLFCLSWRSYFFASLASNLILLVKKVNSFVVYMMILMIKNVAKGFITVNVSVFRVVFCCSTGSACPRWSSSHAIYFVSMVSETLWWHFHNSNIASDEKGKQDLVYWQHMCKYCIFCTQKWIFKYISGKEDKFHKSLSCSLFIALFHNDYWYFQLNRIQRSIHYCFLMRTMLEGD